MGHPMSVLLCLTALTLPGSNRQAPVANPPPAFRVGIELPCQVPIHPAVEGALKAMGITYVNYYLRTALGINDRPAEQVHGPMLDLCKRLEVDYSIATHQLDPPDDAVREAVATAGDAGRKGAFRGVVFDELAHIRLLNYSRPLRLADFEGFQDLAQADIETLAGYERLRDKFAQMGSPVVATHVFPVLLHTAARAGFTVCPKIMKEFYSPVSMAVGLGAAHQYNRQLWADVDLWYYAMVPGHGPEEFRCNLLLAYWLGADLVYVEGAGHNLRPVGEQGLPFSLVTIAGENSYQLTPHGEVLRWFAREYLPRHPRPYTHRDLTPTSAIVRFDDTDFGVRSTSGFTQGLYGTETLRPNADTEAWLGIWHLLTAGKTAPDGITFFNSRVGMTAQQRGPDEGEIQSYTSRPLQAAFHSFFVPLNNAVVYDHLVGYERLKDIPLIFLTGVSISPTTMEAVRRCVREGAACVAWGPLARINGFAEWSSGTLIKEDGKGQWIVTDNWSSGDVYRRIWMHVGRADEIRYRFGDHTVVLLKVSDNEVRVELNGVAQ